MRKLHIHILERLGVQPADGVSFSDEERLRVRIKKDTMYFHKVLRLNYTSYDRRRQQDIINPATKADIMMLADPADQNTHPYYYARVLSIFHVKRVTRIRRKISPSGDLVDPFRPSSLYQVGFADANDPEAFAFVSPDNGLRAVQLVPNFVRRKTNNKLYKSIARRPSEGDLDWFRFYVNSFVDRDMFHRFTGNGIGHRSTYQATKIFREQCDRAYGAWVPGAANKMDEEDIDLDETDFEDDDPRPTADDSDEEDEEEEDVLDEGSE
ncbi:hypothetical protein BDZ89DRAFT_1148399 [Hymenopellis radicata]|nr:hypothetical protein BDZ89DRAFT_1148399 [Hymenopellis radicata]